jgi:hypothetical protein
MTKSPLFWILTGTVVVGTVVVLKQTSDAASVDGLGDPEVHTRSAGTMKQMSYARERVQAKEIMRKQGLGVRYTSPRGTGTFAVRPVTRPKARAYLLDSFQAALAVARENASGYIPYVVIQVEALTDWRSCQDRRSVGCGTANPVAYVDEHGHVTKTQRTKAVPPTMEMLPRVAVVSPALVPELGY